MLDVLSSRMLITLSSSSSYSSITVHTSSSSSLSTSTDISYLATILDPIIVCDNFFIIVKILIVIWSIVRRKYSLHLTIKCSELAYPSSSVQATPASQLTPSLTQKFYPWISKK